MFLGLLRSHLDKFEMLGGVHVSETKPIKARRSSVSGDMYCKVTMSTCTYPGLNICAKVSCFFKGLE